jgi:hypothetical protein
MSRSVASWGVALALTTLPADAYAQEHNTVAVGLSVSDFAADDPAAHGSRSIGPLCRIGHSTEGWGWQWGLNWFETDLDRPIGGRQTRLGALHVRPLMAGYGYTRVIGPVAATLGVLGGLSFNSFSLASSAEEAYRARLGARAIDADAGNSLAAKPQLELWIDVSRRVGLNINAGYLIARPSLTVRSSVGNDVRRVRADMLTLTIGAVYSLF